MGYLGSSLAAMVTDRNLWHTRADAAWGSSGVWNSGTSWQTAYNSEVTLYNNMVTDRDLWQGRANSAWGASRVWNSGSSFESDSSTWHTRADNAWGASRVWNSGASFESRLPPSGLKYATVSWNTAAPPIMSVSQNGTSLTVITNNARPYRIRVDRAGYYMISLEWRVYSGSGNSETCSINTSGGSVTSNGSGTGGGDRGTGCGIAVFLNVNDTIDLTGSADPYAFTGRQLARIQFVPEASYPN